MKVMTKRRLMKLVHWALLVLTVLVVVSGLGITQYQVVSTLTFGLLSKALAFKLHLALWIPFVVVFVAHVLLTTMLFRRRRTTKGDSVSTQ